VYKYKTIFGNYWNPIDDKIISLILKHIELDDEVFEVGFASGHYIAFLSDLGYKVSGVEIRKNVYEDTMKKFKNIYSNIELVNDDVFNIKGKYDLIYSTGLLQALPQKEQMKMIFFLSKMANKIVFIVPQILGRRNLGSKMPVAVTGCEEYLTDNVAYELSLAYSYVETGMWKKEEIGLEDNFLWFYCDTSRNI
jgi:hypothetical protein